MDTDYKVQIFADYFQIWLEDRQAASAQRDFLFTDQHLSDRVWVDDGLVIMFTARNMTVPVEIQTLQAEPALDLERWDHVAETGIDLRSGQLEIFGCGGYPGLNLSLQPGTYRARLSSGALASLSQDGLEGNDHYQILLWPASTRETRILKRCAQAP